MKIDLQSLPEQKAFEKAALRLKKAREANADPETIACLRQIGLDAHTALYEAATATPSTQKHNSNNNS